MKAEGLEFRGLEYGLKLSTRLESKLLAPAGIGLNPLL